MITLRTTLLSLTALTALSTALAMAAPVYAADAPLKACFVYFSPSKELGYSYQHEQGRLAVEKKFGAKVVTAYAENVAEGADSERVINDFAKSGCGIVFTTSFGFMDPTLKVAKKFPDVKFEHATGYKQADNVATYSQRWYEGRYVMGTLAGNVTKSHIVGYVAPFPIPEVISGINAFTIALRKTDPKAVVKVVWVNTWFDPGKERDAATTLISQGADIIVQHTDSAAPVQAAEEKGVKAFGQASDQSKAGPKAVMTSLVDDWAPYYIQEVQAVLDKKWVKHDAWDGIKQGAVVLAPFNPNLPAEAVAKAKADMTAIADAKLFPFAGPIKAQDGTVKIAAGKSMADGEIAGMNWFVEGVQGDLPK